MNESEVKKHIKGYTGFIKENEGEILEEDFWGMKQLAYPIQKKTTGIYFVTEYKGTGELVDALELKAKRDSSVLRFLTVRLDKYAIKYNADKRAGLVGRNKKVKNKPQENKSDNQAGDGKAADSKPQGGK